MSMLDLDSSSVPDHFGDSLLCLLLQKVVAKVVSGGVWQAAILQAALECRQHFWVRRIPGLSQEKVPVRDPVRLPLLHQ